MKTRSMAFIITVPLCITIIVLFAWILHPVIRPVSTVDDLVSVAGTYSMTFQYENMALLIESADAIDMASREASRVKDLRRYLAVADTRVSIPGLTLEHENAIVFNGQYLAMPGLGDDSRIPSRLRGRIFHSSIRFAELYNSELWRLDHGSGGTTEEAPQPE